MPRFIFTLLLMVGFGLLPAQAEEHDSTPRVAVMSAFEPEWQALLAAAEKPRHHDVNGKDVVTARLGGKDVVLLKSGIGMVNAAMSAQMAILRFNVTAIAFSGIAGGVDPSLSIGDVMVADQWAEYLESVFARETTDGYAPPPFLKTPFPNFGMIFPTETETGRDLHPESRFWFPVDAKLLDAARNAARTVVLADCVGNTCLATKPRVIVGGNGVSGSAFVDNARFRDYIGATFQAKLVDMESAAVAHVAYANGIPFIAFRSLSDLAGGSGHENEMATFMALTSENTARLVSAFLTALP